MVCNHELDNIALGSQLVEVYRSWDRMEADQGLAQKIPLSKWVKVVDFDVAPEQSLNMRRYANRNQVALDLLNLAGRWDTTRTDGKYFQQKIISSQAYLLALSGESLSPINDYLQTTMGITLAERIDDPKLDAQLDKVRDCAKDLGFNWNKEGWEKYLQENQMSPEEFIRNFTEAEVELLPLAITHLGLEHLATGRPFYETRYSRIDTAWTAWVSGKRDGFSLEINTHPRNRGKLTKGSPEILCIHEIISHILQHVSYMYNIDRKFINPAYGITTVPGPEQFGLEGSAITAPYLIRPLLDKLSPHALFRLERGMLEEMVKLNALIALNNSDNDAGVPKMVKGMVSFYLPSENEERIKFMFKQMAEDALWRSYFVAYAEGSLVLEQTARDLSDESRQRLAKSFYEKPRTPVQIEQLIAELKARDGAVNEPGFNVMVA